MREGNQNDLFTVAKVAAGLYRPYEGGKLYMFVENATLKYSLYRPYEGGKQL